MEFFELLKTQGLSYITQNDFASAGLLFGSLGFIYAYFRKVPAMISKLFVRTIEIRDSSEFYHYVNDFIAEQEIFFSRNFIYYKRDKKNDDNEDDEDLSQLAPHILKRRLKEKGYPLNESLVSERGLFFYKGRPVYFSISRNSDHKNENTHNEQINLKFILFNIESVNSFIEHVESKFMREEETVSIYSNDRWNEWTFKKKKIKNETPPILPKHIEKNLFADIENFFESEEEYKRKIMPYRRSYLFYGIPGTGKSSLVYYLASKYAKKLYIMKCSLAFENNCFDELIHTIPKNAFVLLEDFDRVFTNKGLQKKVDLSAVLNSLDGILAPSNGVCFFMTANDISVIPEALLRPGRVDHKVYFDNASKYQIKELTLKFFPDSSKNKIDKFVDQVYNEKKLIPMAKVRDILMSGKNLDECLKKYYNKGE